MHPVALFAHLAENGHQIYYKSFMDEVEDLMCRDGLAPADLDHLLRKFAHPQVQTQVMAIDELSASDMGVVDMEFAELFK